MTKLLLLRKFARSCTRALLIFEDDVVLVSDFDEQLGDLFHKVPDDWDMLFLGGEHLLPPTETAISDIVRCTKTIHNHAWIVRHSSAKRIAQALRRVDVNDCRFSDHIIAELMGELITYAPRDFLAYQRPGFSDNLRQTRFSIGKGRRALALHEDEIALFVATIRPGDQILEWSTGYTSHLISYLAGCNGNVVSIFSSEAEMRTAEQHLRVFGESARVQIKLCCGMESTPSLDYLFPSVKHMVDVAVICGTNGRLCIDTVKNYVKPQGWLLAAKPFVQRESGLRDVEGFHFVVATEHTRSCWTVYRRN